MKKMMSILNELKKIYPSAKYYLNFKTPLDLLVAAILSAQVRDEVVNAATPALFVKYKTAKDYASASVSDILKHVEKVTFAENKVKNIIAACKILEEKNGGRVPNDLDALVDLPGVGRKTALVILANAFDQVEGVVCDTHVIRVSYRLGWTKNTNPDKIGADLEKLFPKEEWKKLPWLLKAHGRAVCKAPTPVCDSCPFNKVCPKQGVK